MYKSLNIIAAEQAKEKLLNKETAMYCRQRYKDNFSLEHK